MDTEESNLTDILNETAPEPDLNDSEPFKDEVEAPAQAAKAEPATDDAAKQETPAADAETGDKKEGEPPLPDAKKEPETPKTVPFETVMDERRKRQELERRLAAIEAEKARVPPPDMFEDPEGYQAYQDSKLDNGLLQQRIGMSEQLVAMTVGEDKYNAARDAFAEEVARNPALVHDLRNHPNPAKFAYDVGTAVLDRQEIGNPREFAAREVAKALEAQKATMASEIAKQVQDQIASLIPKSLADSVSTGSRTPQTPVDLGDVPISELLPS